MLTILLLYQLLSNAVTLRRDKSILYSRTSKNILLYCIHSTYFTRKPVKAIGLFGGLFHATSITKIFYIFFFIMSALILQLTAYYPRKLVGKVGKIMSETKDLNSYKSYLINKLTEQFKILEYSLIILFIISGAILLMSSTDLISMFLSIELQSYGLYILSTIYKNSELSTKAGLTYFLLGGLSSCFILLGTSLLYSNTATTNLEGIYVIISLTGNDTSWPQAINLSLIIMAAGFLFKVSAAPFHFWSPDVYDAIPTIVTTFVAIVAKISIFIFLLELLQHTYPLLAASIDSADLDTINKEASSAEFTWINSLLISCLLSLIIGTVLGLTQNRIKRLFAYSTISHVGFLLLALSINSIESIQAFLFYLMQYSLTNLNAFFILIAIGYSYYVKTELFSIGTSQTSKNLNYGNMAIKFGLNSLVPLNVPALDQIGQPGQTNKTELLDKSNSPIQFIRQIKGLFFFNPILSLSLTITIFSFAGIPPLIGFFGKQMVLSAALDSGYYFLVLIAILTSVISAVYYLNIIKEIYFFKPVSSQLNNKDSQTISQLIQPFAFTSLDRDENLYGLANNSSMPEHLASLNIENPYHAQPSNETKQHTDSAQLTKLSKPAIFLVLSNYLTITISLLTLGILLFIFEPKQWLSMANILALNLFNT